MTFSHTFDFTSTTIHFSNLQGGSKGHVWRHLRNCQVMRTNNCIGKGGRINDHKNAITSWPWRKKITNGVKKTSFYKTKLNWLLTQLTLTIACLLDFHYWQYHKYPVCRALVTWTMKLMARIAEATERVL